MTYKKAVQLACERVGTQAALAKAIDVSPAVVHQWSSGLRPVPVQHCVAIERATGGSVTRCDLRPDDWHLIWPEFAASPAMEAAPGQPKATHPPKPAQPLDLSTTELPTAELDEAGLVDRRETLRRSDDVAKEAELQALKAGKGPAA